MDHLFDDIDIKNINCGVLTELWQEGKYLLYLYYDWDFIKISILCSLNKDKMAAYTNGNSLVRGLGSWSCRI